MKVDPVFVCNEIGFFLLDQVDPTSSTNVAQVDGNLLINQIVPSKDFGFYYCVASNDYGSIRSRKVALNSACKTIFSANVATDG